MEEIKGDQCFETLNFKEHILIYFGASWCGPCKEAGPQFEELATKYPKDKIRFFKVSMDEEENKEFIQTNQVQNIPTFILFKDRNFIDRIIGGDFHKIKQLIKEKTGLDHPDGVGVNKKIDNVPSNVNKQINGLPKPTPPQPPPPSDQPKLEDFYPSATFQGGFEKYEYKNGPKGQGYYLQTDKMNPPIGGGGGGLEVHMVYGSWCGHSKRAMPDFEELVKNTSVKTSTGSSVKFVMTEDNSEGMAQFKEKVKGFPTYMVVKGDGTMDVLNGHDRSKDSIITAVKALTY
jgi:thioredoxin 1